MSARRIAAAPELPTATEAGLSDLTAQYSLGLLAPAGTPRPIVEQIAQATRTVLADRTFQELLIEGGFDPTPDSTPEKFRQSLAADIALWTPVVTVLGLKID
jgi:tripartite-type tricarboxylate transporter receptor subunit TctC